MTYHNDPTFWRNLTRKTFRLPDQPLLQEARWQWLYKKLLTQTRLYTWGNNRNGNLGHDVEVRGGGRPPRRRVILSGHSSWPKPAKIDDDVGVGIVADVQCGGWCTTMLDSIGAIYIFGDLDGNRSSAFAGLRRLGFPLAYPWTTADRYEPSTAIQQFSTGRSSVLGLADDGKVWMWQSGMGFQVKPMHVDLMANKVVRVAAGKIFPNSVKRFLGTDHEWQAGIATQCM